MVGLPADLVAVHCCAGCIPRVPGQPPLCQGHGVGSPGLRDSRRIHSIQCQRRGLDRRGCLLPSIGMHTKAGKVLIGYSEGKPPTALVILLEHDYMNACLLANVCHCKQVPTQVVVFELLWCKLGLRKGAFSRVLKICFIYVPKVC